MGRDIPADHRLCFHCFTFFPEVWIEKGDAPQRDKNGHHFCSFSCQVMYKEREQRELDELLCPHQTSPFNE